MDILKFLPRNLTPLRGVGRQALCTPGNLTQMDPERATRTQQGTAAALSPVPGGWKGAENMGAPGGKLLFSLSLRAAVLLPKDVPPPLAECVCRGHHSPRPR